METVETLSMPRITSLPAATSLTGGEYAAVVQGGVTKKALVSLIGGSAVIFTATDGATITFDLASGDVQQVTLGGNRTLAVANDASHQRFTLILNTGAGSFVPVWFSGIRWVGGTAPTVTTTASKFDVFTFYRVAAGVYLGIIVGQAL